MILKLEDNIYSIGPHYEYINSDRIFRIRITRKRIKIYTNWFWYIVVERNKHNMVELQKLDNRIEWL